MQSNITPERAIAALTSWNEERGEAISLLLAGELMALVPIKITQSHLHDILKQVLNNQLDLDELEMWANMLDARDEFDIEEVEGAIYALANAEQMGELTLEKVAQLVTLFTINTYE